MKNNFISFNFISFIVAFVLITSLIGCTQRVTQGSNDPSGAIGNDVQPSQIQKEAVAPSINTEESANPDIVKLYARQSTVKSLSFDFAKLPNAGSIGAYYVKDNLAKIIPVSKSGVGQTFDVVYLDMLTHNATGYCTNHGCIDKNAVVSQSYVDWAIPMPLDWAPDIQYGKIVGTVSFNNKQVTRIQYQKGALYYEAYVDNYFGYPQRVVVSNNSDFKNIISGYEYRNMAFNTVAESDVVHINSTN